MTAAPLTAAYRAFFDRLARDDVAVRGIGDLYVDDRAQGDPDRPTVALRVDVDNSLHLCPALAGALADRGLDATFYFLHDADRHYEVWGSGIPAEVADLGMEVGLHYDHLYEELTGAVDDGLAAFAADLDRLTKEAGHAIRGATYHGHPKINDLGRTNWELLADVPPDEVGLEYHDGRSGGYLRPGARRWSPRCDVQITDYLGFPESWGWNYDPDLPLRQLDRADPGDLVHVAFHPKNAFEYWKEWDDSYGEAPRRREGHLSFMRKAVSIRWRYGVKRGTRFGALAMDMIPQLAAPVVAGALGAFWPTPEQTPRDTSWEEAREEIYERGIEYWRDQLEAFGMTGPGDALEVGSGNGQWLLALAEDADRVVGIEPNNEIRAYSLERIDEHPERADRIEVRFGRAERLPLPDADFDRVLCPGVLMFTRQREALAEIARVLKPGGRAFLTVNGLGYFVMKVLRGLRYRRSGPVRYGLNGILNTARKWRSGDDQEGPTAVSVEEMEGRLADAGLRLQNARLHVAQDNYPKEHLGFPTNFAFTAEKEMTE